jgi:uncharacterized protein
MIEVKIESIRISLMSPNQVVILKEIDGPRCLPVFIGKPEGDAITFKLNHVEVPRPLSHDLAASMIEALDAKVSHVLIKELRGNHFIAALHFQGASGDAHGESEIDARPSDAIAIAVRVSCPIFVEDAVMSTAGVIPPAAAAGDEDLGAFSDFIGSLDLGDLDDEDKSR